MNDVNAQLVPRVERPNVVNRRRTVALSAAGEYA